MPIKVKTLRRRGPLRLDRTNGLTRGIVWCVAPGISMQELVSGKTGRSVATGTLKHKAFNRFGAACRSLNNHTTGGMVVPRNTKLNTISRDFTIAFVGSLESQFQNFGPLIAFPFRADGVANNNPTFALAFRRVFNTTGAALFICFGTGAGNSTEPDSGSGFLDIGATPHVYAGGRKDNGLVTHFYKDGLLFSEAFSSNADPLVWGNNANGILMNASYADLVNFGNSWAGTNNVSVIWNRTLSSLEHAQFAADPGQLFVDDVDIDDVDLLSVGMVTSGVNADHGMSIEWRTPVNRNVVSNVEWGGDVPASGNIGINDGNPLLGGGFL